MLKRHIIQEKKHHDNFNKNTKKKTTLVHNCKLEIVEHLMMHETQNH